MSREMFFKVNGTVDTFVFREPTFSVNLPSYLGWIKQTKVVYMADFSSTKSDRKP